MAEWLFEAGIGESRAALVEHGAIMEALVETDDAGPRVDAVIAARLVERLSPALGRVALDGGGEAMLDRPPVALTVGAALLVEIVRESLPEQARVKLPKAIVAAQDATPGAGPGLYDRIVATGVPVRTCLPHQPDLLEAAGWSEVLGQAATGEIPFGTGVLRLALTPAMTVIDVDGTPPLDRLALTAADAAGRAIRRLGIGGSIVIDFPTLPDKAARQAVAVAIDAALPPPFERTAVNGFGLLQVVRRRERPSLAEIVQADPAAAATRALLRQLERTPPPVPPRFDVPPAVARVLAQRPQWREMLARRLGRSVELVASGDTRGAA